MTIQEMKDRKRELGYTNAQISELTGIPLGTVQKIFSGATTAPRYDTLFALDKLLRPKDTYSDYSSESVTPYVAKGQGTYTIDDFEKIPEEFRIELIDGVIYDMCAPTVTHQMITGYIFNKISNHINNKKGSCLSFIAPIGVQLDCDDKTVIQPDVSIVCDRSKVIRRFIYGAPDFVLEVLSPSTKRRDLTLKPHKYQNAGVREYWIIDPEKKKVMVYDLEGNEFPVIYGFDAQVPVKVLNNECEIDFHEMYEYIRFLYETNE